MREKYESLALSDLRELAKVRAIKGSSSMKKADLIEAMLQKDDEDKAKGKNVEPKMVLTKSGETKPEKKEEEEKNAQRLSGNVELSTPNSKVKIYKIETAEELVIARDTYKLAK